VVIFANVEISLTRTDVPQAGTEKNFRNEIETNSTIEIIIMETSHVTININNAMVKEITDNLTKLQADQIGRFLDEIVFVGEVGRVFPMVVVSILPQAEFRPNDRRKDAPHFISALKPTKTYKTAKDHVTRIDMVLTVTTVVVLVMISDVMMTEDDHSIPIDLSIRTIHVTNPTVTSRIVVEIAMVTIKVA